jgi:aminoglycoside phosphotransferase (APT) family kinase protein
MLDINASMQRSAGEPFKALYPILKSAGLVNVLSIHELAGGLSNHNYKITTPTGSYVLRVNADAADSFCNRQQERFYWQQLAQAKLAPELLWVSEDERYYLSDFIESDDIESDDIENEGLIHWPALERQTSAADFVLGQSAFNYLQYPAAEQETHPNQAHCLLLALLLQLRDLPTGPYAISITEQWQEYHQQMLAYQTSATFSEPVLRRAVPLKQGSDIGDSNTRDWNERVAKLLAIQIEIKHWCDELAACIIKPQFCHRDLNPHNLLLKNNRLCCIDFEYATASHPLCELAVVLATHGLTAYQQSLLVKQYLSGHPYVTAQAVTAVPAAIDMYWVFACYWALLMAAQTEPSRSADYLAWFDCFWPLITPK